METKKNWLLIILMLALCSFNLSAQVFDNSIDKGAAVLYFNGIPSTVPDTTNTAYESELAINTLTNEVYLYNRDMMSWFTASGIAKGYSEPSGNPGTREKLHLNLTDGILKRWDGTAAWVDVGGGGGTDLSFDSDRTILRELNTGVNVGGSTLNAVFEYMYFTPPTISLNRNPTTSVYQVGTSNSITYSGGTTNAGGSTLSNGDLRQLPSTQLLSFAGSVTYTNTLTYAPTSVGTLQVDVFQDWVKGSESGTASAATLTTYAVYPVLYAVSAVDYSTTGDIYEFPKMVEQEGDKNITFNGTGFLYFAIPASWGDNVISQILDPNNLNATSAFTSYDRDVSSSGLANDFTNVPYKLYKLNNTTTATNSVYKFNQ